MFEYARMLVPSHAIVIWSPNPKNHVLILTWVYSGHTGIYLYILSTTQYIPWGYKTKDNWVISCLMAIFWCWFMLAYIILAQYSAACSQKWKKCALTIELNRLDRLSKKQYILRYTMHSLVYIEMYHPLLWIRIEPSCEPVLSRLPSCATHRWQHPASLQSDRSTGPQGGACRAQTATATGWLRRYCCPFVRPKQLRQRSQMGSLLPCSCWTCEG